MKVKAKRLVCEDTEEEVIVYLTLFQAQKADGWAELTALIDSDERLTF